MLRRGSGSEVTRAARGGLTTRRRLATCLTCLSLFAQDVNFKVESKLVIVNISVKDRSGKPITNLTKNDFIVMEDGVRQNISVFDLEKLDNDLLPAVAADTGPALARPDDHEVIRVLALFPRCG